MCFQTDGIVRITGFDYEEQAKDVEISILSGDVQNSAIDEIKAERTTDNPVIGRIYMVEGTDSDFEFNVVRFYDDNTFQGIKFTSDTKYASFYGSYELSDNAITLKMSDKSYSGAVKESGSEIRFGNSSFTDWTDNVGPTDPMLSVFQQ